MPISFSSTSRCCSKYDFSAAGCAFVLEEAGGRVVLDIFYSVWFWKWRRRVWWMWETRLCGAVVVRHSE
jgi:hypothetical protein